MTTSFEFWTFSQKSWKMTNFEEIFEISKRSSFPIFWPRRNLDPFLEFSESFLFNEHAKSPKIPFYCVFINKFLQKFSKIVALQRSISKLVVSFLPFGISPPTMGEITGLSGHGGCLYLAFVSDVYFCSLRPYYFIPIELSNAMYR